VGVPVGTVASRLNRARLSVRQVLRPPGQGIESVLENPKAAA
jgi:DNA-directed RNA polymerase specialized sigma24 family protein